MSLVYYFLEHVMVLAAASIIRKKLLELMGNGSGIMQLNFGQCSCAASCERV